MDALLNGDAKEETYRELIRGELLDAVEVGAVAAVLVLAVLLIDGASVALLAVSTAGAFLLGVTGQYAVFLSGAALVKWRAGGPACEAEPSAARAD